MPRRAFLHDYFQAAVIAVLFALFVRTYLVQAFQIPSPSMEENLLVGDHILVNKFAYGPFLSLAEKELLPLSTIRRGDIIVFKFPSQPEKDYVKRVIGLPGETLKIVDTQVLIKKDAESDFVTIQEAYAQHRYPESTPDSLNNFPPAGTSMPIPAGSYFVMGDNRDDSRDSRDWGTVPVEMIRGKALVVYWSVNPPPPPPDSAAPQGPLQALWQSASAAFTRTRWDRTLHIVR